MASEVPQGSHVALPRLYMQIFDVEEPKASMSLRGEAKVLDYEASSLEWSFLPSLRARIGAKMTKNATKKGRKRLTYCLLRLQKGLFLGRFQCLRAFGQGVSWSNGTWQPGGFGQSFTLPAGPTPTVAFTSCSSIFVTGLTRGLFSTFYILKITCYRSIYMMYIYYI